MLPANEIKSAIKNFIEKTYIKDGYTPSIRQIADEVGIGKSTVQRFLSSMKESGEISMSGRTISTDLIDKYNSESVNIGVLGSIKCGAFAFAEQNVTEYFRLPNSLVGRGDFFILEADGESMIEAGIDDGDYVIIRKQNTADDGDIVVALYENETTLKRFYKDPKNKRFILHPENSNMQDIIVQGELVIQGIAVKMLKDIT